MLLSTLLTLLFYALGALGLILYGRRLFGESTQKVLGRQLARRASQPQALRPIQEVGAGAVFNAVLQSCDAFSVVVFTWVHVGIRSVREALYLLFGGQLGACVIFWIISIFGFSSILPIITVPLVGVGLLIVLSGRDFYRAGAIVVFGLAVLVLGITALQIAVVNLVPNTAFADGLVDYSGLGIWSMIAFALVGMLLAPLMRSAILTTLLATTFCTHGWIPVEVAAAVGIGSNFGMTIFPHLSASTVHTKRVALGYSLGMFLGMFWALPLFPVIGKWMATWLPCETQYPYNAPIGIAILMTLYALVNALICGWGLVPVFVRYAARVFPSRGIENRRKLPLPRFSWLTAPELLLVAVSSETANQSKRILKMFGMVREIAMVSDKEEAAELFAHIQKYESIAHRVEHEITTYLETLASSIHSSSHIARVISVLNQTTANFSRIATETRILGQSVRLDQLSEDQYDPAARRKLYAELSATSNELYHLTTLLSGEESETPELRPLLSESGGAEEVVQCQRIRHIVSEVFNDFSRIS